MNCCRVVSLSWQKLETIRPNRADCHVRKYVNHSWRGRGNQTEVLIWLQTFLDVFRTHGQPVLADPAEQGGCTRWSQKVPLNLSDSVLCMMLCFCGFEVLFTCSCPWKLCLCMTWFVPRNLSSLYGFCNRMIFSGTDNAVGNWGKQGFAFHFPLLFLWAAFYKTPLVRNTEVESLACSVCLQKQDQKRSQHLGIFWTEESYFQNKCDTVTSPTQGPSLLHNKKFHLARTTRS